MYYYQQSDLFEDGYGQVSVTFVVTDTYSELFGNLDTLYETNIFDLADTSSDLELESGKPAEDELNFNINGLNCKETAELAALNLCISGLNLTTNIFCGLFFSSSLNSRAVSECKFLGVIDKTIDFEDIIWNSAEYSTTSSATRNYKFKARPYANAVMDNVTIEDLNAMSGWTAWESSTSANTGLKMVDDRQSFFATNALNYGSVVYKLVAFDDILRRYADLTSAKLLATYGIILNIHFDKCIIPGYFYQLKRLETYYTRYIAINWREAIAETDAITLHINPDNQAGTTNYNRIWINYAIVKNLTGMSPVLTDILKEETNKDFRFDKLCKSFTEFLYKTAECFGLFLIMSYDDTQNLRIKFTPRKDFSRSQIWIKDLNTSKFKISSKESKNDNKYSEKNSPISCASFLDYIEYSNTSNINTGNYKAVEQAGIIHYKEGDQLLLTNGTPLIYIQTKEDLFHDSGWFNNLENTQGKRYGLFANQVLTYNSAYENLSYKQAPMVTNSIYVYTDRYDSYSSNQYWIGTDYLYTVKPYDDSDLPDYYRWIKNIFAEGVFPNLASFLANLNDYENGVYYDVERDLDLPYWCGFSANSNGTSPSWNNLQLGSQIIIDSVTYIVVGIKLDLTRPSTTLKLHPAARFEWTDVLLTATQQEIDVPCIAGSNNVEKYKSYTAGGVIVEGTAVAITNTGTVIEATAVNTNYGKIVGIATNSGTVGDTIYVQSEGIIKKFDYSFTPGSPVYLRTRVTAPFNLSSTCLKVNSGLEDLIYKIGKAISTNEIQFEMNYEAVII